MIDKKLLSILVCPVTKAPLEYDREKTSWSGGQRPGIPGARWHSGDAGKRGPRAHRRREVGVSSVSDTILARSSAAKFPASSCTRTITVSPSTISIPRRRST